MNKGILVATKICSFQQISGGGVFFSCAAAFTIAHESGCREKQMGVSLSRFLESSAFLVVSQSQKCPTMLLFLEESIDTHRWSYLEYMQAYSSLVRQGRKFKSYPFPLFSAVFTLPPLRTETSILARIYAYIQNS